MTECVVEIARDWLGTPYRHQASMKGAGCDCLGLIRGVWRARYGQEPEAAPMYSRDWDEPHVSEALWRAADRHLKPCTGKPFALGQVVLFRMRDAGPAKHLGIISEVHNAPKFIHAYEHHGVVESPLSQPWQRRIVAQFTFPKEA